VRFDEVLRTFVDFFDREHLRFAIIGGLAMQAYGYSRFTRDADFVAERSARDSIIRFAESLGYETLHVSEGYSNHLHAKGELGRVDFMYLDRATADQLFAGTSAREILPSLYMPVPRPEHLAAMKAISMKNAPRRVLIDSPDVQFLLSLPGVNRAEVRDYFARHGLLELFDAIEKHS
jgi:hypothetical protein